MSSYSSLDEFQKEFVDSANVGDNSYIIENIGDSRISADAIKLAHKQVSNCLRLMGSDPDDTFVELMNILEDEMKSRRIELPKKKGLVGKKKY